MPVHERQKRFDIRSIPSTRIESNVSTLESTWNGIPTVTLDRTGLEPDPRDVVRMAVVAFGWLVSASAHSYVQIGCHD